MALTDKLTAIADAIRAKTGGTDKLTLEQMASEIDALAVSPTLSTYTYTNNKGSHTSTGATITLSAKDTLLETTYNVLTISGLPFSQIFYVNWFVSSTSQNCNSNMASQIFVDFANGKKYVNSHYSNSARYITNGIEATYEDGTLTIDLSDVPNQTNYEAYVTYDNSSVTFKYTCYIYGV